MLSLIERDIVSIAVEDVRTLDAKPVAARRWAPVGAGTLASVSVHLLVGLVLLSLVNTGKPSTPRRTFSPSRLVSVVYLPSAPLDLPALPKPEPLAPATVEVRTEEPRPELPAPIPPRAFENRRAEVAPTPKSLPVEAPPRPLPPKPAPPAVVVGAFGNNAVVRTTEPNRDVERVAFDAPSTKATQPKTATTTLGGFDRPVERDPRAESSRPVDTVVAETAFGRAPAAAQPAPASRVVREAGFGVANSRERPRPAEPPATVTPSGFTTVRETPAIAKAAPPPPARVIPVEVLSKPTPTYTDEARKLRIEGEVVLDVEFSASGSVRVLRVIRGLGHGLDEAATRAAVLIQFKPATSEGRPVDSRATVQIVFRLA